MNGVSLFISTVALTAVLTVFIYMVLFFLLSLYLKDGGIVDIGWGLGFVLVTLVTLYVSGSFYPRQLLMTALVALWGVRLAAHIFARSRGRGEDWRYKNWREEWGNSYVVRAFFQIFMLQGFFMLVIAIPIIFVNGFSGDMLAPLDFVGTVVWGVGFFFEAVGDYQLLKFKKNPENRGRIMKSGLWRYTRHPNYFGEVTLWWGIFLVALSVPGGIFTVISPLVITFLLLRVSGVPMLEAKYADDPDFRQYKKETSAFFPWFPKV